MLSQNILLGIVLGSQRVVYVLFVVLIYLFCHFYLASPRRMLFIQANL